MASCRSSLFAPLRLKCPGSDSLRKLYQDLASSCKNLVAIISSKPKNEAERKCLLYLKKYVNSLDKSMLKHLLEFLTASQFLIVDEIKGSFTKDDSKFARRPISNACRPCLKLPSTCSKFCELREEFTSILKKVTWIWT